MVATTTTNPPQTILTEQEFENLTSNYYLSNSAIGNYYSTVTLSRLPWIIYNVEINLNAMLNGRLYKRYPPGNVQYYGVNGLTPQIEQETLLQCLTECVEYRLTTQEYVNLSNNYAGNVSGQNNYSTRNSNAIGLRQDIQAKLSVLGLYANIIVGDKKPDGLGNSIYNNKGNLTISQLQSIGNYLQGTALQFSQPITFNGGINTSNTINCNDLNATTVNASSINTNKLNISEGNVSLQGVNLSIDYNNIQYNFPASLLNMATPWPTSLGDWSFFAMTMGSKTTTSSFEVLGGYTINNPTMAINSTTITSLTVIKCHYQTVNSLSASTLASASWYDSSANSIDINSMLKALYPTPSWSGTISQEQLNNLGINSTSTANLLGIQQVVDKVVGKVNIQTTLTSFKGITGITSVIDPLFQEVWTTTGIPIYNNNTLSLTGSFIFSNYSTGTISPIYTSAVSSLGQVNSPSQVVSQINILIDVYLTVILVS